MTQMTLIKVKWMIVSLAKTPRSQKYFVGYVYRMAILKQFHNHIVLITALAAVALIYYVNQYSNNKGKVTDGMANAHIKQGNLGVATFPPNAGIPGAQYPANVPQSNKPGGTASTCCGQPSNYGASLPLGQNETNSAVAGLQTNTHGLPPSCTRQAVVDPAQLLPKDQNTQFSKMNPMGAGSIQDVSLLRAGYHIGINTVGQSLRNANLQLRSEPPNPQLQVGPWNGSTIGPDFNRRPLEIGCGPF